MATSTNLNSESISNHDMNPSYIYDVFLSFCDKDAAKSFACNLNTALTEAGIVVFRDGDKLRNQDQMITPSVLHAIEKSRISIVVFSKNYADSTRCLQELEKIMKCYRTTDQMVVPVFLDDEGMLEEAFNDLALKILKKVESMCEDFNILGFHVDSRNESEDVKKVVEHVTNLLDRRELLVADHPVGIDSLVQDIIQQLSRQESEDPLVIGILGMGGIGKTTIAKAVYNRIRHDFEANSFLLNVSKIWEQDNGIISLQQQLLSDIYKTKKITIDTVESGKLILQEKLCQKRIFLVLDNVNELDQLNALCGSHKCFGQGSKIVITTRQDAVLHTHYASFVYHMETLNQYDSLQLFSWHAFKQPSPIDGFADLSRDFIHYSLGVPLVLQVIGSFLSTRRSKTEWKSVLEKLKHTPYDDSMYEKLSVLVQQSLVTADQKNKNEMHDLLEELASEIIRRKSESVAKAEKDEWGERNNFFFTREHEETVT